MNRYRIIITGIVQGVGFRPFIYNLAKSMDLKGWVGNSGSSVVIEIDAAETEFYSFIDGIKTRPPVLSRIEAVSYEVLPALGFQDFVIEQSRAVSKGQIFISPDVCTCADCINELKDPDNRRYEYPFINCTNCGPRFTIIRDIPYDRDKTTMDRFLMCTSCSVEYKNPEDRRYHAQPVSCTSCGPVLNILDESGKSLFAQGDSGSGPCLEYLAEIVKAGKIAAIKGIGGYHLACDALNEEAVKRLRSRKHRDDKPFALMMKDIEVVEKYCHISHKERELLKSPAAPVVLLRKREDPAIPAEIARLNRYLGVMLPYTPIHHILFEREDFPEVLVMTSGNLSSEPIFYRDEEAVAGLTGIADVFLTNDRDIYIRTDDSVTRVFRGREYIIRRSRGYVPMPVKLEVHKLLGVKPDYEPPAVLACGGELKNVFCINKGNMFYLSQHIGDLENESTNRSFVHAVEHFKKLLDIDPAHIAFDLHPDYFSSQYGLQHKIQNKTGVQHHKAHIAAGMAENGLCGEVIGVSFDGTGYGEDGRIWGGEFFTGGYFGMKRAGSLQYVMMPGSDSAVKHPWKMALGHLYSAGLQDKALGQDSSRILKGIRQEDLAFTIRMLERRLNCPETSSMGRLFDAVSAILGIKTDISYEGQAAVELEYYATDMTAKPYEVTLETGPAGSFYVGTDTVITQLVREVEAGKSLEAIASSFHATAAEIVLKGCLEIRSKCKLNRVVLSGGVFQNLTLLAMCTELLENSGFEVFVHSQVPANDGGIALGQAIMAIACSIAKS